MNQMMQAVVDEGTAKRAALGLHLCRRQDRHQLQLSRRLVPRLHRRTGDGCLGRATTTSGRCRWNGQGVTGGSLPATLWHSFMSVAHTNRKYIPQIPGLPLHPNQVAEQQRLSELKRIDPALAQAQIAQATQKKTRSCPIRPAKCSSGWPRPCAAPMDRRRCPPALRRRQRNPARRRPPIAHVRRRPLPTVAPRCR